MEQSTFDQNEKNPSKTKPAKSQKTLEKLLRLLEKHRLIFLYLAIPKRKRGHNKGWETLDKEDRLDSKIPPEEVDKEGEFLFQYKWQLDLYAQRVTAHFGPGKGSNPKEMVNGKLEDVEGGSYPYWTIDEIPCLFLEDSSDSLLKACREVTTLDTPSLYQSLVKTIVNLAHDEGQFHWNSSVLIKWDYLSKLDETIVNIKNHLSLNIDYEEYDRLQQQLSEFTDAENNYILRTVLMLFAQGYYSLVEAVGTSPLHYVDMELNNSYLWVVKCIKNSLTQPELKDFPGKFEPLVEHLFPDPNSGLDMLWEECTLPHLTDFLSQTQAFFQELDPIQTIQAQNNELVKTFITFWKYQVEEAIKTAHQYSSRTKSTFKTLREHAKQKGEPIKKECDQQPRVSKEQKYKEQVEPVESQTTGDQEKRSAVENNNSQSHDTLDHNDKCREKQKDIYKESLKIAKEKPGELPKIKIQVPSFIQIQENAEWMVDYDFNAKKLKNPSNLDILVVYAKGMFSTATEICLSSRNVFGVSEKSVIDKDTECYFATNMEELPQEVQRTMIANVQENYEWYFLFPFETLLEYRKRVYDLLAVNSISPPKLANLQVGILQDWPKNPGTTCFHMAGASALNAILTFSVMISNQYTLYKTLSCKNYHNKEKFEPDSLVYYAESSAQELVSHIMERIEDMLPVSDWPNWKINQESYRLRALIDAEYEQVKKLKPPKANKDRVSKNDDNNKTTIRLSPEDMNHVFIDNIRHELSDKQWKVLNVLIQANGRKIPGKNIHNDVHKIIDSMSQTVKDVIARPGRGGTGYYINPEYDSEQIRPNPS